MSQKTLQRFWRLGFLPKANSTRLCWSIQPGCLLGSRGKMSTELFCPLLTVTVNEFKPVDRCRVEETVFLVKHFERSEEMKKVL